MAVLLSIAVVFSAVITSCGTPAPTKDPYGLEASLGDGQIVLSWRALDAGAGGFRVQRWIDPTGPWEELPQATSTSSTVTDVQNRTDYRFRVLQLGKQGATWSPSVNVYYVDPVLPVLRIETTDHQPVVDKETRIPGTMQLDPNGSAVNAFSGSIEINGRGNSTWRDPKKPYRIRLGKSADLMGMGGSMHWVLLANYRDKSQLRSWAAAQASESTDLAWTPEYRHVEVILNGRYEGVYQLAEHVRRDSNRVNIEKLGASDTTEPTITGGYLLELDNYFDPAVDPGFVTEKGYKVQMQEPDAGVIQQEDYIRNHVQTFEDALYSRDFKDPSLGYRPFIDTPSLADFYWVQEVLKNQDAFIGSTYFHKKRNGPLTFGPIWDFDISMGNPNSYDQLTPDGWRTRSGPWLVRLFQDPAFVQDLQNRWPALQAGFLDVANRIEAEGAGLVDAIDNDGGRWDYEQGANDTPSFLAEWLRLRIAWIDGHIGSM